MSKRKLRMFYRKPRNQRILANVMLVLGAYAAAVAAVLAN